ncbi:hypothetical protein PsorP6_004584 [Peronosclerospora sorghi]|uniref:Uncharacterized protein n=1 Tax=Peronosclerospora sorghi TaxID=230839 RepID=A0ACC0VMX2_9STRA|nr:hypothetical protein PsorP6_004584 [Peronosclerospora sorghi]
MEKMVCELIGHKRLRQRRRDDQEISIAVSSYFFQPSLNRDDKSPGLLLQLLLFYGASVLRILATIKWFEWISSKKKQIDADKRAQLTVDQTRAIFYRILWLIVPTECISFWFAKHTARPVQVGLNFQNLLVEYVTFIPKSLLFEIIFDFFHFVMHWSCHHSSWLYKNVHKRHHLHLHPSPLSTYEQDGIDLCLTNVLPFCLAWSLGFPFSDLQLHLLFAYKTYVEVAGHSGLDIKGYSFPQMPLLQSICLRVHDHDVHHTYPHWNFAKRFSFWDKLFHTFRPGDLR